MAPSRPSPRGPGLALLALVVVPLALLIHGRMEALGRYSDEAHHLRQIAAFCHGDWTLDPKLTTVPGYHAASALLGRLLGDCSLGPMRAVNLVFGLLSVAAFYWAALGAGVGRPALRTLQYFFLPLLLPYHFLVYSDTVSLLAVLVGVGFLLRGRHVAAAAAGSAALLLRQTNVVWLLLMALQVLAEDGTWRRDPRPVRAAARRVAPFLAGMGAFGLFVAVNGGVALGDARAHQAGLYVGNVFFLLLCFGVLFAARSVVLLRTEGSRLDGPILAGALAGLLLLFLATFGVSHAYNRFPGFLRNAFLMLLDERPVLKLAAFVPVAAAVATLWLDRLGRPAFGVLYPVAVLSLLPLKLIDHRYAIVPLVLYLLYRREDPAPAEAATLALWAALSAVLLDGLTRGQFAL